MPGERRADFVAAEGRVAASRRGDRLQMEATLIDGQGAVKRLSGKDLAAQLIGDWCRCETE
ncbi:MAG: hypothetical protein DVS81_14570 [Candidatus Accumulibacter meliphilus]|uniref:Uncharacterized protein n=1 Tax=Candidatus Accumulibacter meliphilus TaxID=2211374 RepID=A0A369XNS0_9PROT|nr:MAG: hypothetical protein DVS81_14570 [Candidatus Accumulibacter meliphilus]